MPVVSSVLPSAAAAVSVRVLGGFGVRCGERSVDVPPSAQRVIALLALHGRPLRRLYVASTLWIDATESHAGASLRTALWRVRGPHGALVRAAGGMLELDPQVEVDLRDGIAIARDVLAGALPDPASIAALCDAPDVLPDWYDDWAVIAREQFRQTRLHALESLCDGLAVAERYAEATIAGLAAVSAEPLRESAHRAVMRVHLAEGNASEALRQFEFYRDLVRRDLGLEPTAAMLRLRAQCARRDASVT